MNPAKLEQLAPEILAWLDISAPNYLAAQLRAALSEQPEGKVVPIILGGEMLFEMWRALNANIGGFDHTKCRYVWDRVLAAAPNNAETTQEYTGVNEGLGSGADAGSSPASPVAPASVSAPELNPYQQMAEGNHSIGVFKDGKPLAFDADVYATPERRKGQLPLSDDQCDDRRQNNAATPDIKKTQRANRKLFGTTQLDDTRNAAGKLPPEDTYSHRCIRCGKEFLAIGKRHTTCPERMTLPSKLPLSAETILACRRHSANAVWEAICDQALLAIELEQRVSDLLIGVKETNLRWTDSVRSLAELSRQYRSTQDSLSAMHERAEKAERELAEMKARAI